jgi:hypothetical protein
MKSSLNACHIDGKIPTKVKQQFYLKSNEVKKKQGITVV